MEAEGEMSVEERLEDEGEEVPESSVESRLEDEEVQTDTSKPEIVESKQVSTPKKRSGNPIVKSLILMGLIVPSLIYAMYQSTKPTTPFIYKTKPAVESVSGKQGGGFTHHLEIITKPHDAKVLVGGKPYTKDMRFPPGTYSIIVDGGPFYHKHQDTVEVGNTPKTRRYVNLNFKGLEWNDVLKYNPQLRPTHNLPQRIPLTQEMINPNPSVEIPFPKYEIPPPEINPMVPEYNPILPEVNLNPGIEEARKHLGDLGKKNQEAVQEMLRRNNAMTPQPYEEKTNPKTWKDDSKVFQHKSPVYPREPVSEGNPNVW